MAYVTFPLRTDSPNRVAEQLRDHGYAVLTAPRMWRLGLGCELEALLALNPDWEDAAPR